MRGGSLENMFEILKIIVVFGAVIGIIAVITLNALSPGGGCAPVGSFSAAMGQRTCGF